MSQVLSIEPFSVGLISWDLLHATKGLNLVRREEMPTNGIVSETVNHFGEGHVLDYDEAGNPRLGGF